MQFSIAKLVLLVTLSAIAFAAMRSIRFVGPLSLLVGLLILLCCAIAYPIAILNSPQKNTQLDPASNPVLPYIHAFAGIGAGLILLFLAYVASDPFGYRYR